MSGTISTATYVDGRYQQSNVNLDAILEGNNINESRHPPIFEAPKLGLLSQTVIQSPVTHWILPARLGNSRDHDVAFIGDRVVQLRRLGDDKKLYDVAPAVFLESRIRNARVIDLDKERLNATQPGHPNLDDTGDIPLDVSMSGSEDSVPIEHRLGPQAIVLVLESGDLVFVLGHDEGRHKHLKPFMCRHTVSRTLLCDQPGTHLTVDPSSRYMAIAASENIFAVYELDSQTHKRHEFALRPVISERHLHVKGVIHKLEFLFPSHADPDHMILLLLVVRKRVTRMHVYEWIAGQNLTDIRSNNKKGHALDEKYRIPLMLIPLTIKSAFILVCENGMAVCKSLLEGSPDTVAVDIGVDPPTPMYTGCSSPLWTAWTRPVRTLSFSQRRDDMYIAREDGLVKFLEIDSDEFVEAQMNVGTFQCNIGTAFASLDSANPWQHHAPGDILVASGDSSSGGMYLVQARKAARFIGALPNWSPMCDLIAVQPHRPDGESFTKIASSTIIEKRKTGLPEPDRLFSCTGRGANGAITEIRFGFEAQVFLQIGEMDVPISATWVLPTDPKSWVDDRVHSSNVLLVSTPQGAILLHLEGNGDFLDAITGIEAVDQTSTWLDLSSPNVVVADGNGCVVQITERGIRVSSELLIHETGYSPNLIYQNSCQKNETIVAGALYDNEIIAIVRQNDNGELSLDILHINMESGQSSNSNGPLNVQALGSPITLLRYPTCLSIAKFSNGTMYVVLGTTEKDDGLRRISTDGRTLSSVEMYQFQMTSGLVQLGPVEIVWKIEDEDNDIPETCVNIVLLTDEPIAVKSKTGELWVKTPRVLLAGHRSGLLIVMFYNYSADGMPADYTNFSIRVGSTPVTIVKDESHLMGALVCCDSKLYRLTVESTRIAPRLCRLWVGGLEESLVYQPPIAHVSQLKRDLLVISGRELLALRPEFIEKVVANAVPRHLKVNGTPTRMLYYSRLNTHIVAVQRDGRPTLGFVDLETGNDLGHAYSNHPHNEGHAISFAVGLGRRGDKILSLADYNGQHEILKHVILVGMSGGGLILICPILDGITAMEKNRGGVTPLFSSDINKVNGDPPATRKVCYWTSLKHQFDAPVFSIVEYKEGFICCVGDFVRWMTMEINGSDLKTHVERKLPSHGVSLSIDGEVLNVVTAKDSLLTFHLKAPSPVPGSGRNVYSIRPHCLDAEKRVGLNQVPQGIKLDSGYTERLSLSLISDKDCSVVGLVSDQSERLLPRDLDTVFEAELPVSILRFRLAKCRPPWDKSWRGWMPRGAIPSTSDGDEILGASLDGSIRHFTVLQEPLWRLLHFLQNAVLAARAITSLTDNIRAEDTQYEFCSKSKYIDGDILKILLNDKMLEGMLGNNIVGGMKPNLKLAKTFYNLVVDWATGSNIEPLDHGGLESCFNEVYEILSQLLRPVL